MIKNPEKYLTTAGGKIRCRRCKAQSSRTKLQCSKPALKGKAVCQFHGGYSTGPKTKVGKDRIRAAHFKHGNETLGAKAERSAKSAMFFYLRDLGEYFGILKRTKGRRPSSYFKYDLNDYQNIRNSITRIEKAADKPINH
jgi:hypothetical protein